MKNYGNEKSLEINFDRSSNSILTIPSFDESQNKE